MKGANENRYLLHSILRGIQELICHDSAGLTTSWLSLVNMKLRRRTPLMGPNSGRGDRRFSSRATEVEHTTDAIERVH